MNKSYRELLMDPRWQRKRLEILHRDGFKCTNTAWCPSDEGASLHIHHLTYTKGAPPWECKDSDVVTLCAYCHEECEELVRMARRLSTDMIFHELMSKISDAYANGYVIDSLMALGEVYEASSRDAEATA